MCKIVAFHFKNLMMMVVVVVGAKQKKKKRRKYKYKTIMRIKKKKKKKEKMANGVIENDEAICETTWFAIEFMKIR